MFIASPDRTCDHVDQLYADAHMGRREEDAFDEILVSGSVFPRFSNQSFVLLPHPSIFAAIPVVCDYYSRSVTPTLAAHSLQKVLKSLCNNFVCSEIYIFLLVNIPEPVSQRRIAHTAYYTDGFLIGNNSEYGLPKLISLFHVPIEHWVILVFISWREDSPLQLAKILFLALKSDELITNIVPAFFRYYETCNDEKTRALPSRFCGCAAFVHETEVHTS